MALTLFPSPPVQTTRKPGRPPADLDPAVRAERIELARYRLVHKLTAAELAAKMGVSARTVKRWTKAALGYDDPAVYMLRRIAGRAS